MNGIQIVSEARVGNDPELREVSGTQVCNLSLAVTERKQNKQTSQWEDGATTWLRAAVWGAMANNVAVSLQKGMLVNVVGTLSERKYTNDQGAERAQLELRVDMIGPSLRFATAQVIPNERGGGNGRGAPQQQAPQQQWQPGQPPQQAPWQQSPPQQVQQPGPVPQQPPPASRCPPATSSGPRRPTRTTFRSDDTGHGTGHVPGQSENRVMTRSRTTAKEEATRFASQAAAWLAGRLGDRGIERRALSGSLDRGDITGLVTPDGKRVVAEVKHYGGRFEVGAWLKEARTEARNDRADVAVVIAKRRGTTDPRDQVVFMELRDLAVLLELIVMSEPCPHEDYEARSLGGGLVRHTCVDCDAVWDVHHDPD